MNSSQVTEAGNVADQGHATGGVVGFFDDAHSLIEAMKKVRDAKYQHFDAFTPFPVHGLETAQGLKRSPLPYVTFVAGIAGGCLGMGLQYWTSAVDWPLNIGGKPFFSWQAFIPVTFELTILLAALSTVGAMIVINGLPNLKKKALDPRLTRDRFAIVIDQPSEDDLESGKAARFKAYDEASVKQFLSQLGAKDVRSYRDEGWFS